MIVKTFTWQDEAATQSFAQYLANIWCKNPHSADAVILLHGNLGAGKTTLVRHLLRALGVEGRIKSPTFSVVEPYCVSIVTGDTGNTTSDTAASTSHLDIWHFDLYRFSTLHEWEDSGFRDLFASPGLKLVEWPEKAAGALPQPDWDIYLNSADDDTRQVRIEANTPKGQALLEAVAHH